MTKKIKEILGGPWFYGALALCVLAVGAGGYFLLFGGEDQPPEPGIAPEVSAPAPEIRQETPVVETVRRTEPEEPEEPEEVPASAPAAVPVDDTPVAAIAPKLVVAPLQGEVLTAFSVDELVYNETLEDWRTHAGIDVAATAGTSVMAASAGTVMAVEDDPLMGTTVVIDHQDGHQTTYANLQARPTVEQGDSVTAGQIIGAVGATASAESAQGPHLHFAVTRDGDAIDPREYLGK